AGGSPGLLQVAVDGEEDNGRCSGNRVVRSSKSSLGSGSLASVICESPSETWLTTPRNGNPPLLAVDGSGGSNLAQSCYYVADRDSEEDEEEQLAEQEEELQGQEGGLE
ncbi:unnamed protein product, partial [Laminaria digitata]